MNISLVGQHSYLRALHQSELAQNSTDTQIGKDTQEQRKHTVAQLTAARDTTNLSCTQVDTTIQSVTKLTVPPAGSVVGSAGSFKQEIDRIKHETANYCTNVFDGTKCVTWLKDLARIKDKLDEISTKHDAITGHTCDVATNTPLRTATSELKTMLQDQCDAYKTAIEFIETSIDARESAIDSSKRLNSFKATAAGADYLDKLSHATMQRDFYNSIHSVQTKDLQTANRKFEETVTGMMR